MIDAGRPRSPAAAVGPLVALLGLIALATRVVGPWAVGVVGVVGVAGAVAPAREEARRGTGSWLTATLLAVAAVVAVRLASRPFLLPADAGAIAAALAAAVAEEAFFRRFLYGLLRPAGAAAAVAGTALAFAAVHVPLYGWSVFPLDLAAGLLFGWQRWATGGWSSPAATHALANLLAYL